VSEGVEVRLCPAVQERVEQCPAIRPEAHDLTVEDAVSSSDGGKTFATLPGVDVCDKVAFGKGASDNQPFLYILGRVRGATRNVLYKSEDGGQTWIRISNPDTYAMMNVVHMEGDMRTSNLLYLALGGRRILYGSLPAASASKPVVWDQGVVNGASFKPVLSRGAVTSILGADLASDTASAPSVPLARELVGVQVTVDDQPVPLWYISPGQINFQMPWEAPLQGAAELRVYSGLGANSTAKPRRAGQRRLTSAASWLSVGRHRSDGEGPDSPVAERLAISALPSMSHHESPVRRINLKNG